MASTANRITFGRKFFGCVIATVLILTIYFVTLGVRPDAISTGTLLAYGGFIMFLWTGYIGGNMFSKWVTSKYFHSELTNGG